MEKIPMPHGHKRVIEPFEEMYLAGLSTREIAKLLSVSKTKVANTIKSCNISRPKEQARESSQPDRAKGAIGCSKHWRTSRLHARIIYQKHHNVTLTPKWHVHHKDGDYTNNNIENLELKHTSIHTSEHKRGPEYCIPRHLRPKRKAYMQSYFKHYRRKPHSD